MLTGILAGIRRRPVASAIGSALIIRLLLLFWLCPTPHVINLTRGYIETAATIVSHKGLIMPADNNGTLDVVSFLKSREDIGRRVTSADPFPPDSHGWVPATLHPPGYSLLMALLYEIGNFTGMLWWLVRIQTILDAFTCLLVYVFVRNIFGADAGVVAAWIYALLPAPILLSFQILPDGLSCFFAGAILAAASYIPTRGSHAAVITAVIIGIGWLFRAELLLWAPIVILLLAITPGTTANKIRWSGALALTQVAVLIPWVLWTYSSTGHPLLTSTASGGAMYLSLGEIPDNPWHISPDDDWVSSDATRRGLRSAWTREADTYYKRMFLSCIRQHPASFVHLLLTQRFPLALAPAYYMGGDMWFTTHRLDEGLTRWQTLRKYPTATIRHEWLKFAMVFLSSLFLGTMLYIGYLYRHALRQLAWLWIPWIVTVASISTIHQIDGRLLASNLIVQVAAAAVLVSRYRTRGNTQSVSSQTLSMVPPVLELSWKGHY